MRNFFRAAMFVIAWSITGSGAAVASGPAGSLIQFEPSRPAGVLDVQRGEERERGRGNREGEGQRGRRERRGEREGRGDRERRGNRERRQGLTGVDGSFGDPASKRL